MRYGRVTGTKNGGAQIQLNDAEGTASTCRSALSMPMTLFSVKMVNFHSKCKMLGGVAEFFSEAFLCRFPPEDLPRPVVYPVHSLPV